ncbi:isochorismate synthase [Natrinema sp. 1APR25-10V2]|uniref:isochorismate synthase n=1 Tax=Natrinema sp. 1APR25-10V2 TaxID=2951081 RepID=UPI0028755313|nr:isochorismate synthase [Natrinema sp. 1APR25-10V2]MDS0477427.1 isochorismate synthase [Natrinema sp. 1APR25-10V2]
MDRSSGESRLAGGTSSAGRPAELVSRSRELEHVAVRTLLEDDTEPRVQWAAPDGVEIVGRGVAARVRAAGPDRFELIRTQASRLFAGLAHDGPEQARPRAFGGFSFHDGHDPGGPWTGFPAASFVIPRVLVSRTDDGTWLTTVADRADDAEDRLERWHERLTASTTESNGDPKASDSTPGVRSTTGTTSPEEWTRQVERALERIDAGSLTKVVLAQALSVDLEGAVDVPATLERLGRRYPNCYRFLVGHEDGGTFFGAPPERLVSKRGDQVETEALAGSVARGETPDEDEAYAERMRADAKLGHEHGLVVDAIREQLAPLARELTIRERTVRRLATIQHLQTPIEALLEGDRHVLEIVEALHPTPAVGGVPPDAAWETIRDTETFDRGWYAAPIGWFDAAGDGEFAVGIRSGVATDGSVTLFAGNGIVADSDPDEEWDEVQLKFRPILDELR